MKVVTAKAIRASGAEFPHGVAPVCAAAGRSAAGSIGSSFWSYVAM
jgi:hypothetical protein